MAEKEETKQKKGKKANAASVPTPEAGVKDEEIVEEGQPITEPTEVDVLAEKEIEKEPGTTPVLVEGAFDKEKWHPKTALGKAVKEGKISDINEILDSGRPILETEIVDMLLPNLQSDLLMIGQSKGKFGGGQRRVFKQTQKKTKEGNKPNFATYALVGNNDGFIGLGYGKAKETVPAREKAYKSAKLHVFKIQRGCGSWECNCGQAHTIPFSVSGKCGSVIVKLMPAPKGTGLCIEQECAKILKMAGIKDVWSKTLGQTRTKINTIVACESALKLLSKRKLQSETKEKLHMVDGFSNKSAL